MLVKIILTSSLDSCGAWRRRRQEEERAANARFGEAPEAGAKWRLKRQSKYLFSCRLVRGVINHFPLQIKVLVF